MTAVCSKKAVDGRDKPGHDGSGRVAAPPPVAYLLAMTAAQPKAEQATSVASAHDKILIVDFGSQVTQLIARRVREEGVYSEIVPFQKAEAAFLAMKPKAVILSGGPESVHEAGSPRAPQAIFDSGVPVLGICYGQMTMAAQLGGNVEGGHHREFGRADVEVKANSCLFDSTWDVGEKHPVWMSHGDRITKMPPGFVVAGTSANAPFAVIQDEKRKYYGLMFHPEVVHTPDGAVLIHEAIGDQLTCVFVDHGLLRLNEAETVVDLFRHHYNIPLVHVDASKLFLGELAGVTDPEQKRKTIGRLFIDVFDTEAKKIGGAEFLAQGTLYPDVIESVSFTGGPSVTIKSHHNVGGLPARMNMKLVEPLRELFKDEVRVLGRELGLPEIFVGRHPFPGPGLAIRCPGEITVEKLDILRLADEIYIEEIRRAGLYDDIWQAFAVILPVKTVGVMGDGRTYDYVVGLRAVTSTDGMTADFYPFDMTFIGRVATRIINEVKGVNRVVYDVTSKPPGTIEWE